MPSLPRSRPTISSQQRLRRKTVTNGKWLRWGEVTGGDTWGIHFFETKEVASIVLNPVLVSRSISSVFIIVGTRNFSFCNPSRGLTSTILTLDIPRQTWPSSLMLNALWEENKGRVGGDRDERPRRTEWRTEMVDGVFGGDGFVRVVTAIYPRIGDVETRDCGERTVGNAARINMWGQWPARTRYEFGGALTSEIVTTYSHYLPSICFWDLATRMDNFFCNTTAIFSKKVPSEILFEWRTFPSSSNSRWDETYKYLTSWW